MTFELSTGVNDPGLAVAAAGVGSYWVEFSKRSGDVSFSLEVIGVMALSLRAVFFLLLETCHHINKTWWSETKANKT